MVTQTEWYQRVNAEWPTGPLPKLDAETALMAAKKLYRFALGTSPQATNLTSGNRYTIVRDGILYVNPEQGWHAMVHHLSHWCNWVYQRDNPNEQGHGPAHARMEIRMIKEVVKRKWLETPKPKEQPEEIEPAEPEAIEVAPAIPERLLRLQRRQKAWQAKHKRAENALKKLQKQIRYYERKK